MRRRQGLLVRQLTVAAHALAGQDLVGSGVDGECLDLHEQGLRVSIGLEWLRNAVRLFEGAPAHVHSIESIILSDDYEVE